MGCCHSSIPAIVLLWSHIFRDKYWCGLESFAFLLHDLILAVLRSSSCLSVCHPEHIICLHSSVHSTIPWNGGAQWLSLILRFFNSVEDFQGVIETFLRFCLLECLLFIDPEEHSLILFELLLLDDFISLFRVDSIELVDSLRRDGLFILSGMKDYTFLKESSCRCTPTISAVVSYCFLLCWMYSALNIDWYLRLDGWSIPLGMAPELDWYVTFPYVYPKTFSLLTPGI